MLIIGTQKKNVNRLNKNVHDHVKIQIEIGFTVARGCYVLCGGCACVYQLSSQTCKYDSFLQKVQERAMPSKFYIVDNIMYMECNSNALQIRWLKDAFLKLCASKSSN